MENFWKKLIISASSGVFGKILLVVFGLSVGFFGRQFISVPIDSSIIKGTGTVVAFVVIWFSITIVFLSPMILEWFAYRRESENERLQLENENLKLKFQLQEKQSKPDNDE